MTDRDLDPALELELDRARQRFYEAVEGNPQLPMLLLVDPIHALEDAGIRLSERARRYIRKTYTGRAYGKTELYEAVSSGKVHLPWLRAVRMRRRPTKQEGPSNSSEGGKHA